MIWNLKKGKRPLIFVAHRWADNPGLVGMIVDRLEEVLKPRYDVFIDQRVGSIMVGDNFQEQLDMKLRQSGAVIALIGKQWLDLLVMKSRSGEDDHLKYELDVALGLQSTKLFPIYIDEAPRLNAEDLPQSLKPLVKLQDDRIGFPPHSDTSRDIARLIHNLQAHFDKERSDTKGGTLPSATQRLKAFCWNVEERLWNVSVGMANWFLDRRRLLFSGNAFVSGLHGFPYDCVVLAVPLALCFHSYLSDRAHWIAKLGFIAGHVASWTVGISASLLIPFIPIELAIKYQAYDEALPDVLFRFGRTIVSVFLCFWIPALYLLIWNANHTGSVRWMDEIWNLIFG